MYSTVGIGFRNDLFSGSKSLGDGLKLMQRKHFVFRHIQYQSLRPPYSTMYATHRNMDILWTWLDYQMIKCAKLIITVMPLR